MTQSFFGNFGNKLEINSRSDLFDKLSILDINVPKMTEGRTSEHRERFSIIKFLKHTAINDMLEYPFSLSKGESPDFLLVVYNQKTIGNEHRDIGSTKFHAAMAKLEKAFPGSFLVNTEFNSSSVKFSKSEIEKTIHKPEDNIENSGIRGDAWDIEWAKLTLKAIKEKSFLLNKSHFRKNVNSNELLLYDNSHVDYIDEKATLKYLSKYVTEDQDIQNSPKRFQKISIIRKRSFYPELLWTTELSTQQLIEIL